MERSADDEWNRTACAKGLGPLGGPLHSRGVAGNRNLTGRIDVGWTDDLTLRGFLTRLRDDREVGAENGRHRSRSDRHGFLHVASATPNKSDRVRKCEGAGGDVRRVLAEAVASNECRRDALLGEHATRSNAGGYDRWLCSLGELQILLRTVPANCRERTSRIAGTRKRPVGLFERVARDGKSIGQGLAHADLLRSLTWKDE